MPIKNKLRIRPLKKRDSSTLLKWANDIETRYNSLNQQHITKCQHKQWFAEVYKERICNPALICLKGDRSRLGVIRFNRLSGLKNCWEVHFTVSPKYRGKGFARPMLKNALTWFRQAKPNQVVYANVKSSNHKSLKVLQSIGFIKKTQLIKSSDLVRLRLPAPNKKPVHSPIIKS